MKNIVFIIFALSSFVAAAGVISVAGKGAEIPMLVLACAGGVTALFVVTPVIAVGSLFVNQMAEKGSGALISLVGVLALLGPTVFLYTGWVSQDPLWVLPVLASLSVAAFIDVAINN